MQAQLESSPGWIHLYTKRPKPTQATSLGLFPGTEAGRGDKENSIRVGAEGAQK